MSTISSVLHKFLTFWDFLLLFRGLCALEDSLLATSFSMASAGLFALLEIPLLLLDFRGTLESRPISILTSRDLGGWYWSHQPFAAWEALCECLWVDLWGTLVSVLFLGQLTLTGAAGWVGLWAEQQQDLGWWTPQVGQRPCSAGATSDPAFLCLAYLVLLASLLVSFLCSTVFDFTLGLSVKCCSVFGVASSSDLTLSAVSVRFGPPAAEGFESLLVLLLPLPPSERLFLPLFWLKEASWTLSLLCWVAAMLSVSAFCWEKDFDSSLASALVCLGVWRSVLKVCWWELTRSPSCQSRSLAAGASGYKKNIKSIKNNNKKTYVCE